MAIATWLWFLLAGLLGAGLTFLWPYGRACGTPLYAFLGSVAAFALASLSSIAWSWRSRATLVHFLSIGLLGWSAVLGAREILPRTGYARRGATWSCPANTPAPPAAPAVQPATMPPTEPAPAPAPGSPAPAEPTPAAQGSRP